MRYMALPVLHFLIVNSVPKEKILWAVLGCLVHIFVVAVAWMLLFPERVGLDDDNE